MYSIDFDARQRIMHLSTRGLWDMKTHAAFIATVIAKGTHARLMHGHFAVLADLREHPVQKEELSEGSRGLMGHATKVTRGPIALTVGSMLGKLQAQRVLAIPSARIFLNHDEAIDWVQRCWIDRGCVPSDAIGDGAISS